MLEQHSQNIEAKLRFSNSCYQNITVKENFSKRVVSKNPTDPMVRKPLRKVENLKKQKKNSKSSNFETIFAHVVRPLHKLFKDIEVDQIARQNFFKFMLIYAKILTLSSFQKSKNYLPMTFKSKDMTHENIESQSPRKSHFVATEKKTRRAIVNMLSQILR